MFGSDDLKTCPGKSASSDSPRSISALHDLQKSQEGLHRQRQDVHPLARGSAEPVTATEFVPLHTFHCDRHL